ncbi:hypothetical protein [Maritimibacter fusiformis]|uniref:Uncharacterized protein n=1 Tax=Maritimibacter fusiformis TaxID=2603819 RepID=A0A5D0R9I9_9RHOB|nr:hypothetical protein [Maritimibacter fusiformis]TYB77545.1 hypothetical protein FVF75_14855 [Maritimibacter fusiformis]
MTRNFDDCVSFDTERQIMEVDLSGVRFETSADVNAFYDMVEARIEATGEELWFFLVNYSGFRIDTPAWVAHSLRGKAVNLAHSQGSVRYDVSEETRRQIEHDAETEAFNPNLFADRAGALARIAELPSQRREKRAPLPVDIDFSGRLAFDADREIMDVNFANLTFRNSAEVNHVYDLIEAEIRKTGRKWFFLVNYENSRIHEEAWVAWARRGKAVNIAWSLGSVRYAPGSVTEKTIRMRAESQAFRPNIRNTRDEALARIDELRREIA